MSDPHSVFLVISALVTVVGLILLITVAKLNPFLTLLVASLFLAVVTGMPPSPSFIPSRPALEARSVTSR